jgi:pimeloyl-ACP methyl ester carboxylesterase
LEIVSLAGISMGGGIALGFALNYPHRVERLVLVDSYGLADKSPMHKLSYLFIRIPFINEWTWSLTSHSRSMTASSLKLYFSPRNNA